MATTLEERITIWRLRQIHDIRPIEISKFFPHIPKPSIRRIASTFDPESEGIKTQSQYQDINRKQVSTKIDRLSDDKLNFEATLPLPDQPADGQRITTLQELIDKTDIDLERWKVDRWIANTWESAMKGEDLLPIITTLYQIKAYLKPNDLALTKDLIDTLRQELRDNLPPVEPLPQTQLSKSGRMLEISIPDMHFGKLALEIETGQEYNLDIAERIYKEAVSQLFNSAIADGEIPELILMPIGHDLFNVDNAYLTTYNNTPQENVHSIKHLYRRVKNILRDVILSLSSHVPVHIIIVPGNHDRTITYFLGETLEDIFWNNPNVTVNNRPQKYQYLQWGDVLLGFTHGDRVTKDKLPFLMINDEPKLFANTTWREFHLGHKHTKKDTDFSTPVSTHKGVIIRELPSLTAADNWHSDAGYKLNNRYAEAYLWSKDDGLVAVYNTNLFA